MTVARPIRGDVVEDGDVPWWSLARASSFARLASKQPYEEQTLEPTVASTSATTSGQVQLFS